MGGEDSKYGTCRTHLRNFLRYMIRNLGFHFKGLFVILPQPLESIHFYQQSRPKFIVYAIPLSLFEGRAFVTVAMQIKSSH